ncbi:MAG: retroviral-like aspartic protease family protein [Erythrobacter sp.]|nr:retroviral-like aspartic protease family protein [Erythrobacter sp.]
MSDLGSILTATLALTGGTALLFADATPASAPSERAETTRGIGSRPLPVVFGVDGRLYVPVIANGRMVRFLVDTGASHTLIDSRLARELGVVTDGSTRLQTVGGEIEAGSGRIGTVSADAITMRDMRVLVVEGLPRPILGMDVLGRFDGLAIEPRG